MQQAIEAVCWMDGAIRPARDSAIPVMDHGLLYGDGVFEGIRFYHHQPLLLEPHLQRLQASARALLLDIPLSRADLGRAIRETIATYAGEHGYIRLIVTRGSGPLGIDPYACQQPRVIIIVDGLRMVDDAQRSRGIRCMIAATRRLSSDGLDPRIKSLNYLNHILARMEAVQAGADEALLLNQQGKLSEGTADNLFLVREGELMTPPCSDGALAGITRDMILQLAAESGIPTRETSLSSYDLYNADECFLTGTGAELIPVREVDGRPLAQCPGPVFAQLSEAYAGLIRRECPAPDMD